MNSLEEHIKPNTRYCYLAIDLIGQIRSYLTEDAVATLVCSLAVSKIGYANSLFYGLPDGPLNNLKLVQNSAAKLVMKKKKSDHVATLVQHFSLACSEAANHI